MDPYQLRLALDEAFDRALTLKEGPFEQQWENEVIDRMVYSLAVLLLRRKFRGEQTPLYGQLDLVGLFKNAQSENQHEVFIKPDRSAIYHAPHPDPAPVPDPQHPGYTRCDGKGCRIASPHWHPVAAHPTIGEVK